MIHWVDNDNEIYETEKHGRKSCVVQGKDAGSWCKRKIEGSINIQSTIRPKGF